MAVKFKADTLHAILREVRSESSNKRVGELIVTEMRKSMGAGLSPVRGEGRFVGYKDRKKYPGDLKAARPVNLHLTGDMWNALTYWSVSGRLVICFQDRDEAKKAQSHNQGTRHIPRRHFMPTENGEELNVTITRAVRNLYAEILSDIIRKNRR